MALTSTLFTGLSGLDVNQTRMNVVGNNIANVNTVAFKASRALFKPQFYVTDAGGAAPSTGFGGTNPSQRGLGASVASIEKDFTTGSIEATGKDTDMAIEGSGFFVVQGAEQRFTRDGSFVLNSTNNLVTNAGDFVQGYGVDSTFNIIPGKLQNITIPLGAASTAEATQNMTMTGNLDASGSTASGASILNSQLLTTVGGGTAPTAATLLTNIASTSAPGTPLISVGQTYTLAGKKGGRDIPPETFKVTATSTVQDLMNFYNGGLGIDTTVPANPLAPPPGTTIETDAVDPTSVRLVIAGNTGKENALAMGATSFTSGNNSPFTFQDGTNAAGFNSDPAGESVHTTAVGYDSLGNQVSVDVTAVLESTGAAGGTTWRFYADASNPAATNPTEVVGNGTLTFDSTGKLVTSTGTNISIDRTNTGAKSPLSINLNFSGMTALASASSNMVMSEQDGSPLGSLSSFSVGGDGKIVGSFTNGLTRTLGQVAIATFNNPNGLDDKGGNMYGVSANSGTPIISAPLDLGAGSVRSGALELSNVDLSKEFVNLIIASTGFSAASRVITTSNQLLTELLNTSR
jgi:flagellar hook protein FlgE